MTTASGSRIVLGRHCKPCGFWHVGGCKKKPGVQPTKETKTKDQEEQQEQQKADHAEPTLQRSKGHEKVIFYDFQNSEITLNDLTFFVPEGSVKEFTNMIKQDIKEEIEIKTNDGRSVSGSYPVRQLISDCIIRLGEAELKVKAIGKRKLDDEEDRERKQRKEEAQGHCSKESEDKDTGNDKGWNKSSSSSSSLTWHLQIFLKTRREPHKKAKNIEQCLKFVGKTRRTLDRFRCIYYLYMVDLTAYEMVVTQWKKDGKKQGLTGLAGRCYNICLVKGEKILDLAAEEKLVIVNKKDYKEFA